MYNPASVIKYKALKLWEPAGHNSKNRQMTKEPYLVRVFGNT